MKYRAILIPFLIWLGAVNLSFAQQAVSWRLVDPPAKAAVGERFDVTLRAEIQPGWHLYSMNVPAGGPIPTSIMVQDSMVFSAAGEAREPSPILWFKPTSPSQSG